HSLGDLFTSIIVIFSLKISKKPADADHPFGHGRAEDVGGLVLSLVLIIIGFSFFKDSFVRLFFPREITVNYFFIGIILATAVIKLILGAVTQKCSKKISSPILKTDAFHHYSDVVTSIAVVVGLFFVRRGWVYIDSIVGILVSAIIILWGINTGRVFISNLIGKKESTEFYKEIRMIARSFSFVEGVHAIEVYSYGKNRIVSLHVEMNPSFSLEEAHKVADNIEKEVHHKGFGRCIVHVDIKGEGEKDENSNGSRQNK
ncbi:MAG: cation diffusion facilitator family transporter, partial [Candidatus Omnitrophota bacterium]